MATRRSTRIATAALYVQGNMIFPASIMKQIAFEYVGMFKEDNKLKIVPILTSCHLISNLVIPYLYNQVTLNTESGYTSFLRNVAPSSVVKIQEFNVTGGFYIRFGFVSFKKRVESYMRKQGLKVGKKGHTEDNESGIGVKLMNYSNVGSSVGQMASFFNPISLHTHTEDIWKSFKEDMFPRLSTITLSVNHTTIFWHLDDINKSTPHPKLDIVHLEMSLGKILTYSLEIREKLDVWVHALRRTRDCGIAKVVEASVADHPHMFCFVDSLDSVMMENGIRLKRGCPDGAICTKTTSDIAVERLDQIRRAFRIESEA